MCGRFVQRDLAAVERYFELRRWPGWRPSFNIAPSQPVAIVRREPPADAVVLAQARWGFVPVWVADPARWSRPINARVETLFEKPAWRTAIRRTRCLVPASGWYEWQALNGRKQPYYLEPAAPVALAGVWERSGNGDRPVDTFAVLVAAAAPALAAIHDRAPVTLPEDAWAAWLGPALTERCEIEALLARETPPTRCWPVILRLASGFWHRFRGHLRQPVRPLGWHLRAGSPDLREKPRRSGRGGIAPVFAFPGIAENARREMLIP